MEPILIWYGYEKNMEHIWGSYRSHINMASSNFILTLNKTKFHGKNFDSRVFSRYVSQNSKSMAWKNPRIKVLTMKFIYKFNMKFVLTILIWALYDSPMGFIFFSYPYHINMKSKYDHFFPYQYECHNMDSIYDIP